MTEEIKDTVTTEEEPFVSTDEYISKIQELQNNTVSKADYNKLAEDNRKLANALANGEYTVQHQNEPTVDIPELERKIKHCKGRNDLELMTDVLKLRSARLAVDENDDIFVGQERKASDYANAQAFADQLQEVIDSCDGDPMVFASKIRK